mmetsp:Transcript_4356/g.4868  ORF Transcript_4356/g.4868 Transcript_4356/m.4868 type:complete len:149 (-) Transcript_4356:111-557(-)
MPISAIRAEVRNIRETNPNLWSIGQEFQQDEYRWLILLIGPENSPYEGGIFLLKLTFPEEYPHKRPIIQFITPIYHPNVTGDGQLTLSLFREFWNSSCSILELMDYLIEILQEPNEFELNGEDSGEVFQQDLAKYAKSAKIWTKKHAK